MECNICENAHGLLQTQAEVNVHNQACTYYVCLLWNLGDLKLRSSSLHVQPPVLCMQDRWPRKAKYMMVFLHAVPSSGCVFWEKWSTFLTIVFISECVAWSQKNIALFQIYSIVLFPELGHYLLNYSSHNPTASITFGPIPFLQRSMSRRVWRMPFIQFIY